ncbi:MAG: dienelactone hydrolase family protein [Bacteroidota bacterium]
MMNTSVFFKTLAVLKVCLISSAFVFRPEPQGCCSVSAIQEFAALAKDAEFAQAHELPTDLLDKSFLKKGEMIEFPTLGEKETGQAFVVRGKKKSNKYLFMVHEWWGLNDHIKSEAVKYQTALGDDVTVIALDLYDGNVATTREDAQKYMQGVDEGRARQIIHGAQVYAGDNAKIGTIGWCFGGGWSLQTAILLGEYVEACVIYYGMPEKEESMLKRLDAPVLGIFAENDKWITPEVAKEFEGKLKKMDHPVETHIFPADHAFANPTSPRYHEESATKARALTLEFLKKKMSL